MYNYTYHAIFTLSNEKIYEGKEATPRFDKVVIELMEAHLDNEEFYMETISTIMLISRKNDLMENSFVGIFRANKK